MRRIACGVVMIFAALAARAQVPGVLAGRVEGDTYFSANGAYRIRIPVLPELGGIITDTRDVATFEDAFSTHITIAAFSEDSSQRWQLSTRGVKGYLIYFFNEFVLRDFKKAFRDVRVEDSGRFAPRLFDGALFTYVLIPGGSMFADHLHRLAGGDPPVAKRGNLIFLRGGYIFVLSIELAERVTEGTAYHKTSAEEDAILHRRLIDIANKIEINSPAAAAAPVHP